MISDEKVGLSLSLSLRGDIPISLYLNSIMKPLVPLGSDDVMCIDDGCCEILGDEMILELQYISKCRDYGLIKV